MRIRSRPGLFALLALCLLIICPGYPAGTFMAGPRRLYAGPSAGGKNRIVTLTFWVRGTGHCQWDATVQDPRDGPGTTTRKSTVLDNATAWCMGTASYRIKEVHEDGFVELEKIQSSCSTLGISGGGRSKSTYHYVAKYGGGEVHSSDVATWSYELGPLKEPWRGPELDAGGGGEFSLNPPWLPMDRPPLRTVGRGVKESTRDGRQEYTNVSTHAIKPMRMALTDALHEDKECREKLRGRLDWSKPINLSGRLSHTWTDSHPVSLVHIDGEDVVGGTATYRGTVEMNWTLSTEPARTEMDIIPSSGYERWLPRGAKDEKTCGSSFIVEFDIHKAGQPGVAPEARVVSLTVWLVDTSKQPGVCTNYPKPEKNTGDFDFRIRKDFGWQLSEEGQKAEAAEPQPQAALVLDCYDYGGWTQLMARAELSDGQQVIGRVKGGAQSTQLNLPMDENHNRIADSWEMSGMAAEAAADNDSLPRGNDVEGDGLSQYEEYRGFLCKGAHTRTDGIHKDLFIYDPGNLGAGLFGQSGIVVHFVGKDEFDTEAGSPNQKVINCNRDYATRGPQHLLHLSNQRLSGLTGLALGEGPGPPRLTKMVAVDVAACQQPGEAGVAATIAHELGHATNVWHHGESDYEACDLEYEAGGEWRSLQPGRTGLMIAVIGGQESGVENCIMRYASALAYENPGGGWRWRKKPGKGDWIYGTSCPDGAPPTCFCTDKKGTGVNDPVNPFGTMAGDATKGDCLHQFQINDLRPVK